MYSDSVADRLSVRQAVREWDKEICGTEPAASIAARLALPCGVDAFVCADGSCVLSGDPFRKGEDADIQCSFCLWIATGCQLLLEYYFLSVWGVSVRVCLAGSSVDTDLEDDYAFPTGITDRGISAMALSDLGDFCGLSESGNIFLESVKSFRKNT